MAAGPITINDGGLATKDPADIPVYHLLWGSRFLPATAIIATWSFTITAIRPVGDTALVKDMEAVLADARTMRIRLSGGTVGALYRVTSHITTNESPAQTFERSFLLLIEQR